MKAEGFKQGVNTSEVWASRQNAIYLAVEISIVYVLSYSVFAPKIVIKRMCSLTRLLP